MISKELFIKVIGVANDMYGFDDPRVANDATNAIVLPHNHQHSRDIFINVYELAHKCKEWIYNQEIDISIQYHGLSDVTNGIIRVSIHPNNQTLVVDSNDENEAIFKACQWILDNKE